MDALDGECGVDSFIGWRHLVALAASTFPREGSEGRKQKQEKGEKDWEVWDEGESKRFVECSLWRCGLCCIQHARFGFRWRVATAENSCRKMRYLRNEATKLASEIESDDLGQKKEQTLIRSGK